MLRKSKIIVLFAIFILLLTASIVLCQKKGTGDSVLIKYKADVMVVGIHNSPCLCEDGLRDSFTLIAPKNMSVFVSNDSAYSVNVKVSLIYYSYYRSHGWKTLTKTLTLTPRQSNREVVFWRNTFYDLIKVAHVPPITAGIEILDKNKTDPNTSNNKMYIASTVCQAYVY